MRYLIYKATCPTDEFKCYVGYTSQSLNKRIQEHKNNMLRGESGYFYNALRKYGMHSFEWQILYESNDSDFALNIMEGYMIRSNRSHYSEHGYNLTWGGEGGCTFKDGYNPMKDPLVVERVRIQNLGRHHSNDTKRAISTNRKGKNIGNSNPMKNSEVWKKVQTPEIIEKRRIALKAAWVRRKEKKNDAIHTICVLSTQTTY